MKKYEEVLEYLYSKLPMYQRQGKSAYKKDLTNTLKLLEGIGNPHNYLRTVHIAGSNGKGSSAHAIAGVLQSANLKVGLYTSPHLKEFTERIRVNGRQMPKNDVKEFVIQHQGLIEEVKPSFFEVTVAMAFAHFQRQEVDIAVIETGLGGRLDSTNVIIPEVSLITTIGLEHTDVLGDTVEKIAYEKAGIIKPKVPVVVGDMPEEALQVIEEVADRNESRRVKARKPSLAYDLTKASPYFHLNLPGVLEVIEQLKLKDWDISFEAIREGVENYVRLTGLKGRYQQLQKSPVVIADISHNHDGLRILFEQIDKVAKQHLHVIFGTVKDKSLSAIFETLPTEATYYWAQSGVPRSLPATELRKIAKIAGYDGVAYEDVNHALTEALERAEPDDFIVVTGSTFLVAELANL